MKPNKKDKEFVEYFEKFEKMHGFIINDLRKSCIKAQTNFLTAMGLFNYIETLGAFRDTKYNNGEKFEYVFKNLFKSDYLTVYERIHSKLISTGVTKSKPVYDCLRCGMSHEYLVKTYPDLEVSYKIYGINNKKEYDTCLAKHQCGIEFIDLTETIVRIDFYLPNLIEALNNAFIEYKRLLVEDITDGDGFRTNFITRCENINILKFD